VYVGLSELFCRLQDADKSARYAARAYDLSRSLQLGDLNSRHHRAALLQMAAALRKKGELGDAHDYCSVKFRAEIILGWKLASFRSKIQNHLGDHPGIPSSWQLKAKYSLAYFLDEFPRAYFSDFSTPRSSLFVLITFSSSYAPSFEHLYIF